MNRIEKYYNQNPDKEWNRLQESAYDTIESEITRRFILKYLKPDSVVADIGCGPGHYSTWLLQNGYKVLMSDLSEGLLKLAEEKIDKNKYSSQLLGMIKADATDLSQIQSNSFDITLLFGPLYHLLTEEKRTKAVAEALRITKPDGIILSATINRLCPFLAMMHKSPQFLVSELSEDTEEMNRILKSGHYENLEENPNAFTDAYFAEIDEIPKIYKSLNIELIESFACEGLAAYLYDKAEIFKANTQAWEQLKNIIFQNATRPEILGMSEHVVFVGRKRSEKYPYEFKNLKPVKQEDAEILFPYIHKRKVTDTIVWDGPESLELYREGFKEREGQVLRQEIYMFTIFHNGKACGTCSIRPEDEFKANIGLWIAEEFHGNAIGTSAVSELVKFGFEFLSLKKIEASVFIGNNQSRRIFEENGFLLEGTLRSACQKRGQSIDEWLFGITSTDYKKRDKK